MSDVIKVLQLGKEDWSKSYDMPGYISFFYKEVFDKAPKYPYDLVLVDRLPDRSEIALLQKAVKAYTLFVTDDLVMDEELKTLFACKKGKLLPRAEIQHFLTWEARNYFAKSYGEKYQFNHLFIAQGFQGEVAWNGNYSVTVQGDYGEDFNQIAAWRNNVPLMEGQAIDLWLEYEKDAEVELALSVIQFKKGTVSDIQQKWFFAEEEIQKGVTVDNEMDSGSIFISLLAKGSGKLRIIALHDRYSRRGHGVFLPGGERFVASNREEVFYYFDPGDMKPPLNIYFSGFKTMQGFEAYNMIRSFGCPFLLFSESRLSGGTLYMGTEEYEQEIPKIIRRCMKELGFTEDQVIMSGISMGSFGAMYYGCDILPHAIIVGKPVASLGDVAANERIHRPGGMPATLDMLNYLGGNTDEDAVRWLNQKFWNKFDDTKWEKTTFALAYMIEDDYDGNAYNTLISHLKTDKLQIYGKGIHGRHNDETAAVVSWFKSQYEKILYEDFSRRKN